MADQEFARSTVVIDGNAEGYVRSIDAAVARTKAFQVQQNKLVQDLSKNEAEQKKVAESLEKATSKYGANSDQAQKLAARLESLQKKEQALGAQLKSVNAALDGQQKELEETGNSAGKAEQGLSKVSDKMSNLTKLMTGILSPQTGKNFLKATIGSLSEFEQYETSFAVMLGDMGKAKSMIADLKQFAAETPLGMTDLTGPTQTLLQFGVTAEDVLPTLKMLGDVSLGNKDKFNSLALVFGQIQSTGRLMGQDLLQLINAGFNPLQVMAEKTGKSVADLKEEMEDGAISAEMVTQAFRDATSEGGQFAGALEAQSKTLAGTWSTLKDNLGQVARDIGEDAFGETKKALKDISAEVDKMSKNGQLEKMAKSWGAAFSLITKAAFGLTEGMVKNKEAVGALIAAYGAFKIVQQTATIWKAYTVAVQTGTKAQAAFNAVTALNPYILLASSLAVVVGGMVAFAQTTDESTSKLKELKKEISSFESSSIESASSRLAELEIISKRTVPQIDELREKVNRNAGENEILKSKIEEVNAALGQQVYTFNEASGAVTKNTENIEGNIEALKNLARAEAVYERMKEKQQELVDVEIELYNQVEERKKLDEEIRDLQKEIGPIVSRDQASGEKAVQLQQLNSLKLAVEALNQSYDNNIERQKLLTQFIDDLFDSQSQYTAAADESAQTTEQFSFNVEAANKALSDQYKALEESHKNLEVLKKAEEEYNDTKKLSVETLEGLSTQYSSLKPYVDNYLLGLIDEKQLMAQFPAIYAEDEQAQRDYLQAKAELSESYYKQNVLTDAGLYQQFKENYGIDLKNFSSLAQAKGKVEMELIGALSESWGQYYKDVGGNATKTAEAMQKQLDGMLRNGDSSATDPMYDEKIRDLQKMIDTMKSLADLKKLDISIDLKDFSPDLNKDNSKSKSKEKTWQEKKYEDLKYMRQMDQISEEEYLQGLEKIRDSYIGNDEEQYRKYNQEIHSIRKSAVEALKKLDEKKADEMEKIVKDSFNNQLKIAQDYFEQQKKDAESAYKNRVDEINDLHDDQAKKASERYESEIDEIQGVIDALDREIQSRRKAREEEKLDDDLTFAQNKIQTLQTQIRYARTPEERAELEKELKRQQEELKDLSVQKEINELEAQKTIHEDQLKQVQDEYDARLERIEACREAELESAEEIRDAMLKNLEKTFNAFSDELHKTYKQVNDETLEIGQKFANATNDALKAGFTEVSTQAKSVVDEMLAKVQAAVANMESMVNSLSARMSEAHEAERSRSTSTYSDSRSASITNNNYNGLTAGQVDAMMARQVERILYGRR